MTTEEKQERAGQLYREGRSQQAIAEELGVSENTVTAWKKKGSWGLPHERSSRAKQKEEAFALFRAGSSQQDIGRALGVSENTITTWKKRGKWEERMKRSQDTKVRNDLIQLGRLVQAQAQQVAAEERPRAGHALRHAYARVCRLLDYPDLANEYGAAVSPPTE